MDPRTTTLKANPTPLRGDAIRIAVVVVAIISMAVAEVWAGSIRIELDAPPEGGSVVVTLFASANAFGDFRDPNRTEVYPADGSSTFVVDGIECGEYALVVHHDLDDDGLLDKNFIGIPTEPLAFSNGYEPKGPPSYKRARFSVLANQNIVMKLELNRALGRRGRLGVGLGGIVRGSPYRDFSGQVSQVIPAITYNGERIQVLGPAVQVGVLGTGRLRLAAVASYRLGVYDESDSPIFEGMGDRRSTLMAGLGLQAELAKGLDLALRIEADVLDRVGGTTAGIRLDKSFQLGVARLVPSLGINWQSAALNTHDFGVTPDEVRPERPLYELGSTFSAEIGVVSFIEVTRDWLVVFNVALELFDDEVKDSPIVVDGRVVKGFLAVNYVF